MEALVEVTLPKFPDGVGLEPLPQLALGPASTTWLGALNISVRNSRFVRSLMVKCLNTEKSSVPRHGFLKLLREQVPNVPGAVLVKAAGLNQPSWLGLGKTGSTPGIQLSRVAFVMKLVP